MTDYDREQQRDQLAENKARPAWAYGSATTTGVGSKLFARRINFGVTFYEKPMMSYGYEIVDADTDATVQPQCTGFVYDWVQDERGNYIGAYVGVNVSLCDCFTPETTTTGGGGGT